MVRIGKTMREGHRHRAIPDRSKEYLWTSCVTPRECAASWRRQAAHGNIVIVDFCSCGATRRSELNAGLVNYGPWVEPDDD